MKTSFKAALLTLILMTSMSTGLIAFADIFRLSQSDEIKVGTQAASQVERSQPVLPDSVSQDYIIKLGRNLVARSSRSDIPYRFRIIDSREVNAFALPGGFIYINRGLIEQADNESELVGVVAHEIAHVTERHSVEQLARAQKANLALIGAGLLLSRARGGRLLFDGARLATNGVFLKFSRDAEREADRVGAQLMYNAGWNPTGMVSFFDKLAQKGARGSAFFSTHPQPQERRANISDLIASWGKNGKVDSPEFKSIKKRLLNGPPPPRVARR